MRGLLITTAALLALAAASTSADAATNECRGITACIPVAGPWVLVPAHGQATYLLTCPAGRSVVGGLDAQASSPAVRVSFDGRLGAPVGPGVTTTRYALFRAISFSGSRPDVPATARVHPDAGRRRSLDRVRTGNRRSGRRSSCARGS